MAGTRQRVGALLTARSPRSYGRPGLVVAIVVAVLAVTFATGYTTTRALTGDDSAWMRKGVTIAHINGPSARYDAVVGDQQVRLASSASDPLEVVQEPDGQVFTADPATRQVFRVDLATMTPQPGPSGTGVLAAGSKVFIVDRTARTVTPWDPQTLVAGRPIPIPAPIFSATIAGDGTVYIGETDGAVTTITGTRPVTVHVAPPQDPLDVTVVGSRPVAVDPENGVVYALGGGRPPRIPLRGPTGGPIEVATNQPDGPLWLVQGNVLESVDLASGQTRSAPLASGDRYESPVTNGGRVYVPDVNANQVLVLDAATLAPVPTNPIAVPPGAPGPPTIEVIAKDHQVWIDNPTSRDGKLANPNGTVQTVDKGTGDQVVDPTAAPAPPSPAPPTATSSPASGPAPAVAPTPVPTPSLTPSPTPLTGAGPIIPSPPVAAGPPAPPSPPPSVPQPPTSSLVAVPTDLAGQTESAACAELQAAGLVCRVQYQAQAAQKPDIVAASKPNSGSVAKGTTVEVDVDEVPVPNPAGSATPAAYCAQADAAGFTCSTHSLGQGTPANSVVGVAPGVGTLQPPGTAVVANYYSSTPPPPQVVVPNCANQAPTACAMPQGLTAVTSDQTTARGVACDTVWNQSPQAGTSVPQGTTETLVVDPYCAAPLYELHHTGTNIWYLNTTDAPPSNSPASVWTTQSYAADAYPLQNGSCLKGGTVPLSKWMYPATPTNNFDHYYFTADPSWHDPGWVAQGPIACVFNSAVSGSVAVYGHYINRPNVPGDWSWELTPSSDAPYPVWYQVQHA